MKHLITKITSVAVLSLYEISIVFDDDTERTIDLEPVLYGPVYGPLREPALFRSVQVDKETGTIVWSNGADFDPATLYRWKTYKNELAERAMIWKKSERK